MHMRTHTRPEPAESPARHWIVVVELHDDPPTGRIRRRHRSLPNLHVAVTVIEPGPALDQHWERNRKKKPGVYGPIRYDLMDRRVSKSKAAANRRRTKVIRSLMNRGFTVNGDLTMWSTYVIELDHTHIPDCPGWFYVGMTSKRPVERVWEHKQGIRNVRGPLFSRDAHKHFVRWRPDVGRPHAHFSREAALQAEARLRIVLEVRGYRVSRGTERYDELRSRSEARRNPTSEGEID